MPPVAGSTQTELCAASEFARISKVQPNAQALRTLLTQDASPGARNSKGYQEGYQQVIDALEKGNHGQEIAACVAGLNGHGEHEDHDAHHGDGRR